MSDLLTKASGCYSEILQYFLKYEHIHFSRRFEDFGKSVEFHSSFKELKKMAEYQLFHFL